MQQFLYWRMQALLLCGVWRPSEGDRCSGRWYGAAIEQQALGACVESFQGHVVSLSLHGWHLSRNLRRPARTFLARLVVLLSSSELDVRATAHIQRCGQTPRRYVVHCQPRINCSHWSLASWWSPPLCWASKASGEKISSYRKPQRRLSLTKWDLPHMVRRLTYEI
jgi:hypothetical protein